MEGGVDIGAAVLRDVCTDEILDLVKPVALLQLISNVRSEERRVGKECSW